MKHCLIRCFCLVLLVSCVGWAHKAHAQGAIVSEALGDISPDSLGLPESATQLPADMWRGTDYPLVSTFLPKLAPGKYSPHHPSSVTSLKRRFLLTTAEPPEGMTDNSGYLFDLRVELLLAMGEGKSALILLEQLPEPLVSETQDKVRLHALFKADETENACQHARKGLVTHNTSYWIKVHIFCLGLEKKLAEAELAIALMEEEGGNPALDCCDISLLNLIQTLHRGQKDLPWPATKIVPTAIERMMLEKAGYAAAKAALPASLRVPPEVLQPLVVLEAREPAVWNPEQALTWLQAGDVADTEAPMTKAQLANQLFTIMEGLGHDIPEQAWAALSRIPTTAPTHTPSSAAPALLWRLEVAAIGERVGEVVLLSLVLLESPPDVLALSRILRALRQVGLEKDAEAIALDMLHVELP